VPPGYELFDGGDLGFQMGVAPGWTQAGTRAPDGVNFADPSKQGALLVHVGRAQSPDLDVAAGAVLFELTGGSGAAGGSQSTTTLSGRKARKVTGGFDAGGSVQRIQAVVMVEGGRAWVMALAGPSDRVTADRSDFDRMSASFRLLAKRPAPPAQLMLGEPAPGFAELDRIKGPVVVNFFATWCGPCRQEMPMLSQQASQAHGRFTVLAVDTQDDPTKVPAFFKELGVSLPTAVDRDGKLTESYQLPGVPSTFFLDANHVARHLVYGPLTADTLAQGLKLAGAA
jgi:thiol-disulfide isomerase/thioredoxin